MTEELKQSGVDLAMAACEFISEEGTDGPQLFTAHLGDELTLTIMICPTLTESGISDRLGAALSKIAESVMNE